jgi:hypothetical protein
MSNKNFEYGHRRGSDSKRPSPDTLIAPAGRGFDPTLYHIIIIGQSNGTGANAVTASGHTSPLSVISPTPFYRTKSGQPTRMMLSLGVRAGGSTASGVLSSVGTATDLPESLSYDLEPLAEVKDSNPHGETVGWGLSYRLSQFGISTIVSSSSGDGLQYASINKGSKYYANTLRLVNAAYQLSKRAGRPYKVLCLIAMHGEADQAFSSTGYAGKLATWRSDYERDVKAITGQGDDLILYGDQQISGAPGSVAAFNGGYGTALQWWLANKADPNRVVLMGSRYHNSAQQTDGTTIHLSPWGQREQGERYAMTIYRHQFLKASFPFRPVAPIPGQVNRSGTTVTANFYCPVPPLQLAFDYVSRLASPLHGFTYYDDSGTPPTITAVTQTGPTQFQFALSGTPTGTAPSEALRGGFGTTSIFALGGDCITNLCDSETTRSFGGVPLRNWCINFHEAVT